jgi:hypothetical protein
MKHIVEIDFYELKNDVQIVGSCGMTLRLIICPREVTHFSDVQSACDTVNSVEWWENPGSFKWFLKLTD